MRLINRVLTVVAPVAMVGVIAPTIASCSCSPNSMTINYGDDINCKEKDDTEHPYHDVEEVKTAIKVLAPKETRKQISTAELGEINNRWSTNVGQQEVYFDLVASKVITDADTILLTGWKVGNDSGEGLYLNFVLNSVTHTGTSDSDHLTYKWNSENKLCLYYGNEANPICTSYRFFDCTQG